MKWLSNLNQTIYSFRLVSIWHYSTFYGKSCQIIHYNLLCFDSFYDSNHLIFYTVKFILWYRLYRFDFTTNQITKCTISPSLIYKNIVKNSLEESYLKRRVNNVITKSFCCQFLWGRENWLLPANHQDTHWLVRAKLLGDIQKSNFLFNVGWGMGQNPIFWPTVIALQRKQGGLV